MEQQMVVICVYAEEGTNAAEIVGESFRLFLQRELRNMGR